MMNKHRLVVSLAGIILLGVSGSVLNDNSMLNNTIQVNAATVNKQVLIKIKSTSNTYNKKNKKTSNKVKKGLVCRASLKKIGKKQYYYLGNGHYVKKSVAKLIARKPQKIILTKDTNIFTSLGKNTGEKLTKGSKRTIYATIMIHNKQYYLLANGKCILKSSTKLAGKKSIEPNQSNTPAPSSNTPTPVVQNPTNETSMPVSNEPLIKPDTQEANIYSWLSQMQLKNGLIESAEDSNQVSLYDNALSAIVFTANGDYDKAEKIFDFFNAHLATEFDGQNKGFAQFRDRDGVPTNNKPNRWLGDNAWLLIALDNYQAKTGSNKYANLSNKLESWIRSLQDTDGGLWGGTDTENKRIDKNTEGILDAFVAVKGYDSFHKNILNYLKNNRYNPKSGLLKAAEGKYMYPLDLISWGYGMLKGYPNDALLKASILYTSQIATATKNEVSGYSFDVDRDTIWIEGTGEMAVSFNIAGMNQESDNLINEMNKMFISSKKFKGAAGLPYATNPGTGYGTGKLWDGVDTNIAISSSAWYLLAKTHYNPYGYAGGRDKNIPIEDQFYLNK